MSHDVIKRLHQRPTDMGVKLHNCFRLKLPEHQFVYDVGPRPAAFKLQVFKCGARGGRGYGVRPLERIPAGAFICTYWGKTTVDYPKSDSYFQGSTTYTLHVHTKPIAGSSVSPPFQTMCVNSELTGNVSRWINCSSDAANVEPRFFECDHPRVNHLVIGFYALHDIVCGEELVWDYGRRDVSSFRSMKTRAGAVTQSNEEWHYITSKGMEGELVQKEAEMVRDPDTGSQMAAQWTFGYHPWKDSEDFAVHTAPDGVHAASAMTHTGMLPTNGPWPATVFAGEYEEDDDDADADDDADDDADAAVVAAGGTSAKGVQRYRDRVAYWEPTPVFKGMAQEGFAV